MKLLGLLLALGFLAVSAEKKEENPNAHGFGDEIEWVKWDNAVSIAMDLDKPIFLLVHKTWCGACKTLKTTFRVSTNRGDLIKLSEKFVMTNTEDDEEPEDEEFAPDGRYIPRIFFLDKNGKRLAVDNKKAYPNNHFYYPQINDIVKGMKKALELIESPVEEKEETVEKNAETKKEEEKIEGCPHAAKAKAKKEKEEKAKKEKKEKKEEPKNEKKSKKEEKKEEKKEKKSDDKPKEKKDCKKEEKKTNKEESKKEKSKKEESKTEKSKSQSRDKSEKKAKSKKSTKTEL